MVKSVDVASVFCSAFQQEHKQNIILKQNCQGVFVNYFYFFEPMSVLLFVHIVAVAFLDGTFELDFVPKFLLCSMQKVF